MTLQYSVTVRNARLSAIATAIGTSGAVKIFTGSPPANCAAADTGARLASIALPSTPFAAPSAGSMSKSGTWEDTAADATGISGYFRGYDGSAVCHVQGLVSFASTAWAASTAYTLGQKVSNGGNVYNCSQAGTSAGSGGPTGTGTAITDNTAKWDYVSAVGDMTVDNTSFAAGQDFIVSTFTLTAGNA